MLVGETLFVEEKKNGRSSKVNKDKWFLFFSIRFVECLCCRYILSIVTKTMCNGEEQKKKKIKSFYMDKKLAFTVTLSAGEEMIEIFFFFLE